MTIKRYEHACLVVNQGQSKLVIDPGVYSPSFKDFEGVSVVVITHVHADHFDVDKVKAIIAASPSVKILTVQPVADQLNDSPHTIIVGAGDSKSIGDFKLDFFGGEHALIHESIPLEQNVGVMVNQTLCYPGDSFAIPTGKVKVLAIPGGAPWMKIGEAMDYLRTVRPSQTFPVHNAILSEHGLDLQNRFLGAVAARTGTKYHDLTPGSTLEIN